jgi:hypothetical protein
VRSFHHEHGAPDCLAVSPDGKLLITAETDGTALVWDLACLPHDEGGKSLKQELLQSIWGDLNNSDPLKVYGSLQQLRRSPEQGVAFISKKLRPTVAVDPKRIARLIADLDNDEFDTRQQATQDLAEIGEQAEDALRSALADHPSLETARRLEGLIQRSEARLEARRIQCAIFLLEHLDAKEARTLLEALAKGAPDSSQTKQAKAALERLALRTPADGGK